MIRTFPRVVARTVRLIPWWHLGLGLAGASALAASRRNPYPDDLVFGLRVGAVAFAASAAFVFDDPAVSLLDGKPVPLSLQRLARLVVTLPVVAAGWWVFLSWMNSGLGTVAEGGMRALPRTSLTLEFTALVGIVWVIAVLVMRTGREAGGMAAAISLLTVVVVLLLLPERWSFFPSPAIAPAAGETPSAMWLAWLDAHRRWAVLATVAWTGIAYGISGTSRRAVRVPTLGRSN
jgi:hypothetical protein